MGFVICDRSRGNPSSVERCAMASLAYAHCQWGRRDFAEWRFFWGWNQIRIPSPTGQAPKKYIYNALARIYTMHLYVPIYASAHLYALYALCAPTRTVCMAFGYFFLNPSRSFFYLKLSLFLRDGCFSAHWKLGLHTTFLRMALLSGHAVSSTLVQSWCHLLKSTGTSKFLLRKSL